MNEQLKSQIKGLQHPSALLRRQSTLGVFALLSQQQTRHATTGLHQQQEEVVQEVLLTCLSSPYPVWFGVWKE